MQQLHGIPSQQGFISIIRCCCKKHSEELRQGLSESCLRESFRYIDDDHQPYFVVEF